MRVFRDKKKMREDIDDIQIYHFVLDREFVSLNRMRKLLGGSLRLVKKRMGKLKHIEESMSPLSRVPGYKIKDESIGVVRNMIAKKNENERQQALYRRRLFLQKMRERVAREIEEDEGETKKSK